MSTDAMKERILSFIESADSNALQRLSIFIDEEQSAEDWWDETPDETKNSIEDGIRDADAGKVLSYEAYKQSRPQWFTK